MSHAVLDFYDRMAPEYHLMFADWHAEIRRQGEALAALIRRHRGTASEPVSVLDCAYGIGTQAIGLALQGFAVHATDLSRAAVDRARDEAAAAGARVSFGVADFLRLEAGAPGGRDVVICCDNAIAHVIEDDDLVRALSQMRSRLVPGGLLVLSIRDYDALLDAASAGAAAIDPGLPGMSGGPANARPTGTMPRVFEDDGGRRIAFQTWDWSADGRSYAVHQYFLREAAGEVVTTHYASRFRALRRHELEAALRSAGFGDIGWQFPGTSGFYQPIVTART